MKTAIYKLILSVLLLSISSVAISGSTTFKIRDKQFLISISDETATVYKNGLEIFKKSTTAISADSIFITDFNFDGYPDIAILRDSGIEKYYDVFIFDAKTKNYFINAFLSSLPCPHADAGAKLISSTCNHGSACETWTNSYQIKKNKYILKRREGVNCDPISGQMFKYYEVYDSGKLKKQMTIPFSEKK